METAFSTHEVKDASSEESREFGFQIIKVVENVLDYGETIVSGAKYNFAEVYRCCAEVMHVGVPHFKEQYWLMRG